MSYMKKNKTLAACLIVVVIVALFSGCDKKIYITTGLKDSEIFKISGEASRLSEVLLVLMTEKSRYESELGKDVWDTLAESAGITLEDEIKHNVKNEMTELKIISQFADKQGIELSKEEIENIKNAATEYMSTLDEEQQKVLGVTLEDVQSLYTSFYKAEKVYDKLTANADVEVSDEQARVIEVNYIFVATCRLDDTGNKIQYTEEELKQAEEKVARLEEALSVGNDFKALAEQYSDNTNYNRIFARGEMVENFEVEAFKLKTGEISDIVKTDDGYYFIQCVSDYLKNETNAKKIEMEDNIRKQAYLDVYEPFKAEQTFEFNDDVWDAVQLIDYQNVITTELYSIYNKWMVQ